jgi:hypothetical protein
MGSLTAFVEFTPPNLAHAARALVERKVMQSRARKANPVRNSRFRDLLPSTKNVFAELLMCWFTVVLLCCLLQVRAFAFDLLRVGEEFGASAD